MKKRYSGPQIVTKLRQVDVLIGKGKTVLEVCKEVDISQQTYYHWRQKYSGMSPDMIKQLRAVQKENAQRGIGKYRLVPRRLNVGVNQNRQGCLYCWC